MKILTGATYCSGIGAPELANQNIVWKWCAEVEPNAAKVHHCRFGVPNLGDVTADTFNQTAEQHGKLNLLVGGTPCQAFSLVGLRKSLSDERGNITLSFCRTTEYLNPDTIVWENVPGVLSTRDNAFGCLLGSLVGADSPLVVPKWRSSGVVIGPKRIAAWRVLNGQFFGVPQRRRRVFVVASTPEGADPRKVLFEPKSMCRNSQAGIAAKTRPRGVFPCITRRGHGSLREEQGYVLSGERIRHPLPEELEALQGFPVGFTAVAGMSDTARAHMLGNSMAVPCVGWVLRRIEFLINSPLR